MEDETGLSNVIITPDTYAPFKRTVVDEPYLLVEGMLQNQDGAVSVKAERIESLKAQARAAVARFSLGCIHDHGTAELRTAPPFRQLPRACDAAWMARCRNREPSR